MNTQIAEGSLKDLKGSLKQTWSKLTDDDLLQLEGGMDQVVGKIQKAYGMTKEKASEEFEKFKTQNTKYFRDGRDSINNTKEKAMSTASQLNGQFDTNKIKNKASHMIEDDIIDPARHYIERARDMSTHFVDRTSNTVKENPGYAILGAATIGFLAGAYFFRRK